MGGRAFVLRLWWALAGLASEFGMRLPSTILGGLEELMCWGCVGEDKTSWTDVDLSIEGPGMAEGEGLEC